MDKVLAVSTIFSPLAKQSLNVQKIVLWFSLFSFSVSTLLLSTPCSPRKLAGVWYENERQASVWCRDFLCSMGDKDRARECLRAMWVQPIIFIPILCIAAHRLTMPLKCGPHHRRINPSLMPRGPLGFGPSQINLSDFISCNFVLAHSAPASLAFLLLIENAKIFLP